MKTYTTVISSALVALIVAGGLWLALPAKTPIVGANAIFGNTSIDGSQSNLPNPSNSDYDVARLALGLGTNLSVSATGAGNVNIEAQRMNMLAATTTPCAIQNPFNATSTLVDAAYNVTTATSTAASLIISTSTTAYGVPTSGNSPVFGGTLAANAQGTFSVGETASSTGYGIVLAPTAWVVFTLTSANTLGGTCSAVFQSV